MKKNNVIYVNFHSGQKMILPQNEKITFLNKLYMNIKKIFKCESSHVTQSKKTTVFTSNKRNMS